jgi:hypothetical protein
VALASSSVMHAARAGREREPGQDTWMPPRHEEGLRDDRVPGEPGRSRAEGRTPARGHPAGLDAGRRPGPRNVAAGLAGAVQGRRAAGGCGCSACPALPAVTLSHAEGHGERAHCRRSGACLGCSASLTATRRTRCSEHSRRPASATCLRRIVGRTWHGRSAPSRVPCFRNGSHLASGGLPDGVEDSRHLTTRVTGAADADASVTRCRLARQRDHAGACSPSTNNPMTHGH